MPFSRGNTVERMEGGPPERFAAHVRAELARWAEVVRVNNIERITE